MSDKVSYVVTSQGWDSQFDQVTNHLERFCVWSCVLLGDSVSVSIRICRRGSHCMYSGCRTILFCQMHTMCAVF